MMRTKVLNIPNCITMGRMAIIPVLVVVMCFLDDSRSAGEGLALNRILSFVSALLVGLAMTSDIIDGYYARRYGLVSTFGKFLDPLADKLLFIAAMIMMIPLGRIPAWIAIVFLAREMIVNALRGVAVDKGIVISASLLGKYKSAFITSATIGLLLHYPFFGVEWRLCAWVMLVPAFTLSVVSGIHYVCDFFTAMRQEEARAES